MADTDILREVRKWRKLVWDILDPESAASGEILTADGSGSASYQPAGGGGASGLPDGYYNASTAISALDTAHDIEFTGKVRDSADTEDLDIGSTPYIKQLDANWAAGNNQGGLASAVTLSAGLTVHMFFIGNGSTTEAGFDTSLTATNLLADATGYTTYRRVASMVLDASSNWTQYIQRQNDFILNVAGIPSTSDNAPGTGVNTYTLTEIPDGIEVKVYIVAQMLRNSQNASGHWFETALNNMNVTGTAPYEKRVRAGSDLASVAVEVWSNTSRQVSYQQDDANPDIRYGVVGWYDPFEGFSIGGQSDVSGTSLFVNGTPIDTSAGQTSISFGIPPNVKEFTVGLISFSTNGTSIPIVRLNGETTNYLGTAALIGGSQASHGTGFQLSGQAYAATNTTEGHLFFKLIDPSTNTWSMGYTLSISNNQASFIGSGTKALTDELNQVTLTTLGGTDTFDDGTVNVQYDNPANNALQSTGVSLFVNGVEQSTASGTEVDFSGIPAGIKEFCVLLEDVSLDGTQNILAQLGTGGTPTTTGYGSTGTRIGTAGGVTQNSSSSGITITRTAAADRCSGVMMFKLQDETNNTWVASYAFADSANSRSHYGGGSISLSGALDFFRLNGNGGTYDGGSVNIQYDDPVSGGAGQWQLIETRSITAVANEDFTFDETAYTEIKMIIEDIIPATDGASMEIQLGSADGATIYTGASDYVGVLSNLTAVAWQTMSPTDAIQLGNSVGSNANESMDATIHLKNFRSANTGANVTLESTYINSSGDEQFRVVHAGLDGINVAVDTIRVQAAAGNLEANGTIRLFGLRQ